MCHFPSSEKLFVRWLAKTNDLDCEVKANPFFDRKFPQRDHSRSHARIGRNAGF